MKTINLSDVDAHGMVYFDNELGGMVLNPSGTKVAYIAEAKKPKNSPFFPTKNKVEKILKGSLDWIPSPSVKI